MPHRMSIVHYLDSTQLVSFYNVGLVDLTAEDFSGSGIDYTGLPLWDTPLCNILPYLGAAADIINTVVTSGGRIMVNCQMGVSRLELMLCTRRSKYMYVLYPDPRRA